MTPEADTDDDLDHDPHVNSTFNDRTYGGFTAYSDNRSRSAAFDDNQW